MNGMVKERERAEPPPPGFISLYLIISEKRLKKELPDLIYVLKVLK